MRCICDQKVCQHKAWWTVWANTFQKNHQINTFPTAFGIISSICFTFLSPRKLKNGKGGFSSILRLNIDCKNWNNLKKITDFCQLFQPTANCFISSICFTVLRPRNETIWGGDSNLRKKFIMSFNMSPKQEFLFFWNFQKIPPKVHT